MKTSPQTDFLTGFVGLMAYWLAGELIVSLLHVSLPGAVAGMLLLLVVSIIQKRVAPAVAQASQGLLSNLALLYVPAGVGIMTHAHVLTEHGLGMLATVVLSTAVTLGVTALTLKYLLSRQKGEA
ncbi:CidA/LrgA family protein [Uliginosibacterium sp. H3]|uniref:CidA/LrgA family protein n=1 Tax=Uliginosibacterium silvisoli TaxID=3114758 RepID=A0ABU6K5E9_9RHOO|nr:CidA/LrgA family protein [Uliginosibacterium sp. H3]